MSPPNPSLGLFKGKSKRSDSKPCVATRECDLNVETHIYAHSHRLLEAVTRTCVTEAGVNVELHRTLLKQSSRFLKVSLCRIHIHSCI